MIGKMLFALFILSLSVAPTFAADQSDTGMQPHRINQHGDMMHQHGGMMHGPDGMMPQMMQNPQHMLAMAYHKNLVSFAKVLEQAARKGDTVPRDFARAAVVEMRRSADQMEIYHEQAAKSLTQEQKAKHAEMAKAMEAHLAQMKAELAQLDDLTKADRVDSKELLKHLQVLLKGCREMCGPGGCGQAMHHGGGMRGEGMPCGPMQGPCKMQDGKQGPCMPGGKMDAGCRHGGMQGGCKDCCGGMKEGCKGCEHCGGMHGKMMHHDCMQGQMMHRGGPAGWPEMMQQRQQMMAQMKAQDAELTRLAEAMNQAPQDRKQGAMVDLLNLMVKQRVEMVNQMEQLQEQMKSHMGASMQGMDDETDGSYDDDSGDMEDDTGSGSDMDMKGMKM